MTIKTNNDKPFLIVINKDSNSLLFLCDTNLTCLSKLNFIYVDKTFQNVPEQFIHIFIIRYGIKIQIFMCHLLSFYFLINQLTHAKIRLIF